jgi:hypothetical protein
MLAVPPERIGKMTPHIRQREEGRSIHTIGPYTFARMHVICIRAAPQRR